MQTTKVKTLAEAQAIRSSKINAREGALILDATKPGAPQHLIEKIMDGARFIGQPLGEIKWKRNPLVILVGDDALKLLGQIELVAPGFTDFDPNKVKPSA